MLSFKFAHVGAGNRFGAHSDSFCLYIVVQFIAIRECEDILGEDKIQQMNQHWLLGSQPGSESCAGEHFTYCLFGLEGYIGIGEGMSRFTKIVSRGIGLSLLRIYRKWPLSLTKECTTAMKGCEKRSRNSEIFSVELPMAEIIGLPGGSVIFIAATKQLYKWYFPSVCLSVCHTFFTMFPSSYHHEIFRSYYQWPK